MRNLLQHWDGLSAIFRQQRLLLAFDYDGTLTLGPEANPDFAARVRSVLARLHRPPERHVAIVSGRLLRHLRAEVGVEGLIYSGNHGLEIEAPEFSHRTPLPADFRAVYERLRAALPAAAVIEDKELTLSVNFGMDWALRDQIMEAAEPWIARDEIRVYRNKYALDVQPAVDWDKGRATRWIQARLASLQPQPVYPRFMGDDQTDETAFRALRHDGLGVLVGQPRDSWASYYLPDARDVLEVMERISSLPCRL